MLAVTNVVSNTITGEIIEADIIVNDNYYFNTNATSENYLGDVLTHEIGHFLGLGHSEVETSSMIFALGGGQSSISSDDAIGIRNLYATSPSTNIKGRIVAKETKPVFGAHVEFFSKATGKVLAGALTDSNGYFNVQGIDEDIFVGVSPIKNSSSLSS